MIGNETLFYNSDAVKECYSYCPNECNVMSFEMRVNSAQYPNKAYLQLDKSIDGIFTLWQSSDSFPIRQSTSMVNIYYESKEYTITKETPQFSIDYLIANLGGNLSLFSGLSFLTCVEFIELALSSLLIMVCINFHNS